MSARADSRQIQALQKHFWIYVKITQRTKKLKNNQSMLCSPGAPVQKACNTPSGSVGGSWAGSPVSTSQGSFKHVSCWILMPYHMTAQRRSDSLWAENGSRKTLSLPFLTETVWLQQNRKKKPTVLFKIVYDNYFFFKSWDPQPKSSQCHYLNSNPYTPSATTHYNHH